MIAYLRVPWAFLVRDFRDDSSYKIGFLFRVASAMINVAIYYFIASAFDSAAAPYLSSYGGNYFAFVLIGVAFSEYLAIGIGAIGDSIRQGQTTGTLELMLLSPTRLVVTLLSSSLWSYVFATLRVFIYLIVGVGLGMRFDQANVPFALLTHALELLRRSLLNGEGFAQLWGELAILAGLTLVLLPLGLLACQLAIRIARTDGSLSHY